MTETPGLQIGYLADYPQCVPDLVRWHQAEWAHLNPGETIEQRAARLRGDCGRGGVPSVIVAREDGRLVGSASLVAHDMGRYRSHLTPWLAGVFVRPDARRRGIGSILIRRIEAEAATAGIDVLYLYTETGETLYTRLGWSVVERCAYKGVDVVIMMRKVATETAGVSPGASSR